MGKVDYWEHSNRERASKSHNFPTKTRTLVRNTVVSSAENMPSTSSDAMPEFHEEFPNVEDLRSQLDHEDLHP